MEFDLKGWLLPQVNVWLEINGLMPLPFAKCLKMHGMIYKELCLHESWADN